MCKGTKKYLEISILQVKERFFLNYFSSANQLIFCEFLTGLAHVFSATILHSSVLFPHEVSLFLTLFLRFPALLPCSRPSKKPQQIPRQQPLVPTLLLELGENQPRKQVSTSTVPVKVLHHLFEVFLCFHNSDFLEFGCKGNTSLC